MSVKTIEGLAGCGTALVTPFLPDGRLDEKALESLVDWQIGEGVHFLIPCGTTGESPTLTHKEHLRVIEITARVAGGRVPILAGAGGNNTAEIIDLVKEIDGMGADVDGILSVSPYYSKPTQEGIYQHFEAIAGSTHLPIVVYNVPGRTSSNILPETMLQLAEIPNVIGVKEASGDISQIAELCTRAPARFRILAGDDAVTLPLIALGGHGVISVASNEVPGLMARFTSACLEGRWDEARDWNRKLFPLLKVNFVETSPIPVKAALAMMGRISEVYRLPLVKITEPSRAKLAAVLSNLDLLPR
jgi:4-hydroxy-tetrahydrodipicolinate synthase